MGSDLDVVLVVDASNEPFETRPARWDLTPLPVPVEALVYTAEEWAALQARDRRFDRMLTNDTVWLLSPDPPTP